MAEAANPQSIHLLRTLFGHFVNSRAVYRRPLHRFFHELHDAQLSAVVFGGTLRDLVLRGVSEQPRDVDVVVDAQSLESIESLFRNYVKKRTRFGGLHLNVGLWPIDIWALPHTWALRERDRTKVTFSDLPGTTFLDVEAVAAEIWPASGHPRQIFESGFFSAIEKRTLGINHAANPFPELCVVRSLLTAARLDFRLASNLVEYVVKIGTELTARDLETIQTGHYGKVRCDGIIMRSWIDFLANVAGRDKVSAQLPVSKPLQLAFWQDWNPSC